MRAAIVIVITQDMPEAERIVFKFFRDEASVKKLMEFLSLENKKGKDQFDVERWLQRLVTLSLNMTFLDSECGRPCFVISVTVSWS